MPPDTYAEVVEQNRQALAQATLADPNSHFPYKHDTVIALLDEGVPMGPGMPGGHTGDNDDSRTIDDYMTRGVADASAAYVAAQAAHLEQGTPESLDAYNAARDELLAARLDHRQNRPATFTIGAAAGRGGPR